MSEPAEKTCSRCGCSSDGLCMNHVDGGSVMVRPDLCDQCLNDEDVIGVSYGSLRQLDDRCTSQHDSLEEAMSDVAEILIALGIVLEPDAQVSPHLAVQSMILPKIARLMATSGMVTAAEDELRERAKSLALPEIDLGGGRKAVQVGRRLPPGFLRG